MDILKELYAQQKDLAEQISRIDEKDISAILEAIKDQRWYFFKNKPKLLMDRNTAILWPNLEYFRHKKNENDYCFVGHNFYDVAIDQLDSLKMLGIDGYKEWKVPAEQDVIIMLKDKSFPYTTGENYKIFNARSIVINVKNTGMSIDGDFPNVHNLNPKASQGISGLRTLIKSFLVPMCTTLVPQGYAINVSHNNKVYSEEERLKFTLQVFINNELEPIFKNDKITQMYKEIFIIKPDLQKKLQEIQSEISKLPEKVLLSSSFDYRELTSELDITAINASLIQYHKAIVYFTDSLMNKIDAYEKEKSTIIQDFNIISLELSKKYNNNSNFTIQENSLFENRQKSFKRHLDISMSIVKRQLLTVKRNAESIAEAIVEINMGDNPLKDLAVLERQERASFNFIVENCVDIVKNALLKIEFFEANNDFVLKIMQSYIKWRDDYKVLKTSLKDELKSMCEEDRIEPDVWTLWFDDWSKKRIEIEQKFDSLVENGWKGYLLTTLDGTTAIEMVLDLLEKYNKSINKFYIEERKSIYQNFSLQNNGDLQDKIETEKELYKINAIFQQQLSEVIFKLTTSQDRMILLEWSEFFVDLQIDQILLLVKDNETTKISLDILKEFSELKRKNFDTYLSDAKAYSNELKRREKEFNSLLFRMKKDLLKV